MPKYRVTSPDGKTFEVTAPDGASEQDIMSYAQSQFSAQKPAPAPEKPFGQQMNDHIAGIPRQLGLTARYAAEGVGNTLDFLATPFRAGLNAITPDRPRTVEDIVADRPARPRFEPGALRMLSDVVGLPQPSTPQERVVGDMTRAGFGMALPVAGALGVAKNSTGVTQAVAQSMAARPVGQLVGAAAGAGAGGYVRETGGNPTSQFVASLAGSLAAPMAMGGATNGMSMLANAGRRAFGQAPTTVQIDLHINNALQDSGVRMSSLPPNVAASLRNDVQEALKLGNEVSPDAIRRLADYRLLNMTPNASNLTLDPGMVTRTKNLAKQGMNSKDPAAQQLGNLANQNNNELISNMNSLGANTADDAIAGAQKVIGALDARNSRAQSIINDRYAQARATDGRQAALDPHAFTNRANDLLDEAMIGGKLPADVRNLLNNAATGKMPLNVSTAEQFKTRIGELQRASIDKAERMALGKVRQALDETPLLEGQGQDAINAFNRARATNRAWMGIVEKTPALQAVRDGVEPDKFVQQFIVGSGKDSTVMSVAQLKNSIKGSPEAMQSVREQIASYLKSQATNNAADEVGRFGNSAFNKALNGIGERKLRMFFAPDEVEKLKAIGRVASYEQVQPVGSAVNNSNTASGLAALVGRIADSPILSKLPFGQQAIAQPLGNIALGMQAKQAMNVPSALTFGGAPLPIGAPPMPGSSLMLPPAALLMGMGYMDPEEQRRRGLLSP